MLITYSRYFGLLLALTLCFLVLVSGVNFYVDPSALYREKKGDSAQDYARSLVFSNVGLYWPKNSWNERNIKRELALYEEIQADCTVLGSSHVMQISSFRENKSLLTHCRSLINLAVAGGGLEDLLAFTHILLNRKKLPEKIVMGIDPWTLDLNRDVRWERLKHEYSVMRSQLDSKSQVISPENQKIKYWVNLINPQYFVRSLETIGKSEYVIEEVDSLNLSVGAPEPVLLPDGSLVYSSKVIRDSYIAAIPVGGKPYKLKAGNRQVSDEGIELLVKLVEHIKKKEIDVIFILTPYHENVWQDPKSPTTKALVEVEAHVIEVANTYNIPMLGSYDPQKIGCESDEFYDFMHPRASCLAKIK